MYKDQEKQAEYMKNYYNLHKNTETLKTREELIEKAKDKPTQYTGKYGDTIISLLAHADCPRTLICELAGVSLYALNNMIESSKFVRIGELISVLEVLMFKTKEKIDFYRMMGLNNI